ncbi:translocation/assembly module TamB domain-containing protein [Parapedobacter sp. 2B3]|uniref:translocation/assembly module TamB domain-containing protein n=1 Tax=Parapedobacter sp. 2B3 TaxID=3342381 RepID=UPI0035B61CE3
MWTLVTLLLLLIGLIYTLQYQPVQTFFAKRAANYLSDKLRTTVSLDGVYFKPFSSLVLRGLYVADLTGDTLLYASELTASVNLWKIRDGQVTINKLALSGGSFFLNRQGDSSNLAFIVDYFRPATAPKASKEGKQIVLDVGTVDLADISFRYRYGESRPTKGIDYRDIRLTGLSGHFSDIDLGSHLFKSTIEGLTFREKSGFHLREMRAVAVIDTNYLELEDLYLETNRSQLGDYLRFGYTDFSAFANFMEAVTIELKLDRARVNSRDIEFFAPEVAITQFDVVLSGLFTGNVSDISARDAVLRIGDRTRLSGNFDIRGLPDIEHTIFDMKLHRLATNRADIESLVGQLGNNRQLALPAIFDRMGDLAYEGTLVGTYYNFEAIGVLETTLGAAHTAVNLSIRDGGHYSGKITTPQFDLGTLLQYPQIGHGGFDIDIAGDGFTPRGLNSHVAGNVAYLDVKGYRYTNIDLAGEFSEMQFTGNIEVDDPNLQLLFDGGINFNPERPEYAFDATVGYAHLHNLHLYSKTPVIIEGATIATNFNGNALNNMQGNLALYKIGFLSDSLRYAVDSLVLEASGNEAHRTVTLRSDLADATVNGEMDLTTLHNYFKSVAMQYAPSLALAIGPTGKQAFDFSLQLKDIEPVAALVVPKLALGDGAMVNARFSSADGTAAINLIVPDLSYGMIRLNRLIVDESANDGALRLLVTADRISVTDSLYINNVNLSNVMAGDSLHFNLKLSDITASNQLDLNGMVNFQRGLPTRIHMLPSALVLNDERWELDDNALAYVSDGEIDIHGLEISNRGQTARLEGIVSDKSDREVSFTFQNFNLSTFNPLMASSSIKLDGILDGHMEVSSLLKSPFAVADMVATNVRLNQTPIGDAILRADFDRVSELVNVNVEAERGGRKTLSAVGTYDATAENDKLNVNAHFNHSELILFQPLLGKLVSDVSGTVSADLQVTGSVLAPQINGRCRLHNAGFTVNYLQAPYRIDDEFVLTNSTIHLDGLVITDPRNRNATANGHVDMRNPLIPDVQVTVDAADFLVLNTTFRDNPSYYGTAYGTGRFSFNGPTNAMQINIQARTDAGTRFHIPLNAVGTVSDNDFIRFVSHDTLDAPQARPRLFQGLSMNMDLQITPDAETSLYTDLGELTGRGESTLSLRMSSLGDFEMFGDYTINTGKFTFTAQDFINKIFEINEGGTIRWTGQPTDATINLAAVYGQRTSLAALYNAAGRETVEQRVLAHAVMNLNGNLMRPDITFGLNFPNDPYVNDELQSYLSDANNVNQQALSLIVRRSFAPGSATDFSRELNNTLLSAGTELAFNQLNNLISQSLNIKFVDLNIRSLNDASASLRLFNDRLIFTGGVADMRNVNDLNVFSDRIVTDAELRYLIRKDGRLVLRGSNRLNSRNFLPLTINENYVSALGLVYRQEFYTFHEFFRRLVTIRNEKDEKEAADHPENQ